jgi:hypothetical protein
MGLEYTLLKYARVCRLQKLRLRSGQDVGMGKSCAWMLAKCGEASMLVVRNGRAVRLSDV